MEAQAKQSTMALVMPIRKGRALKVAERYDVPVRIGEWAELVPHPTKPGSLLLRSRKAPAQYVQLDTMKGVRLALRILAFCERAR